MNQKEVYLLLMHQNIWSQLKCFYILGIRKIAYTQTLPAILTDTLHRQTFNDRQ